MAVTANLSCTGADGPGNIIVEIARHRWWGDERIARQDFNVPLNSNYNYTVSTSCAGQGTYTYDSDAVAFITFPLPYGGKNTVAESDAPPSGTTTFTC